LVELAKKMAKKKVIETTNLYTMGKVPPQAVDVEEVVLGALLLEKRPREAVFSMLKNPRIFYKESHELVYTEMQDMFLSGIPIDIVTVTQRLKKSGKLEIVGGPYYISQLTNRVASSANIEYHCGILIEKFVARELIRRSMATLSKAYDEDTSYFDLLDETVLDNDKIRDVLSFGVNKPYKITGKHVVSENSVVMSLQDTAILTKGNINLIISPPGTGKSQMMEIVLASHINNDVDTLGFKVHSKKRVLLIDTERDQDDAFSGFNRIIRRTGKTFDKNGDLPGIDFWSFRKVIKWQDRRMHLRKFIESKEFDLILLDGYSHFIGNINDVDQSEEFVGELMSYTSTYRCGIMGTLHNNFKQKDNASARGHLGGALMREAYTYYSMYRDKTDPSLRVLSSKVGDNIKNRGGKDDLEVYFRWNDEHGMFMGVDASTALPSPAVIRESENTSDSVKSGLEIYFDSIDYARTSYKMLIRGYCDSTGKSERSAERDIIKAVKYGVLKKEPGGIYSFEREESPF